MEGSEGGGNFDIGDDMSVVCTCRDWKENIDKVNAGFTMLHIHGQGGYNGKLFVYCPWCGEILEDENKQKVEEPEQDTVVEFPFCNWEAAR